MREMSPQHFTLPNDEILLSHLIQIRNQTEDTDEKYKQDKSWWGCVKANWLMMESSATYIKEEPRMSQKYPNHKSLGIENFSS